MTKKFILIFLLLILVIFGYFYKITNIRNNQIKTITFSSWGSDSEINILKPILANFENENPDIKIDFMHIPQNYFQKLHLLYASNTAPDVIFINNQYLPIYANAGVLEDLTNYGSIFEFDKFYKNSLNTMNWGGKLYAIPRDISNLVIFYNKDLFKKYGVSYPDKNWSMEDFLNKAKKLTHLPNVFGVSFEEEPLYYLPFLTSEGLNEPPVYEKIKNQKGLEFYANLRNKFHVAPKKEEAASATMAQLFLQEKLAMHISGRWLVPKYRQEAKFDWDIAQFPQGTYGSIVPMDASGWAISKSSKHKKEALKLIKYLSSEKVCTEFAKSGLIVPARVDCANSKDFLDNQNPKNTKAFLYTAQDSVPTAVTVNYKEIIDDLKSKTEAMFNN